MLLAVSVVKISGFDTWDFKLKEKPLLTSNGLANETERVLPLSAPLMQWIIYPLSHVTF